jgi:hypothetical protein
MTKLEAVLELFKEADAINRSVSAANRIKRACDALGLSHVERFQLYGRLEYHDDERWYQPREAEIAGGFADPKVMAEVREAVGHVMSGETH